VFRLPRPAYLAVLFLALAVTALVQHPIFLVAYVVPILATGFIARTATIVDADGLTVRALFGSRHMRWDAVRGISVTGRNVYAVTDPGAVRLPCVRIRDLATVAAVSGGRLPELPQATPKYAPARRRR
jgi:hypothetical protein